jgi:hypothetical protein
MMTRDEQSAFEPRLPEDPGYWAALAERITDSASPVFAELQSHSAWWGALDRLGPALGISALAASVATVVLLSGSGAAATSPSDPPAAPTVTPTDLVENAFLPPSMPDVITLMVLANEESQ